MYKVNYSKISEKGYGNIIVRKVTNEEVLDKVGMKRQLLNIFSRRQWDIIDKIG